MVVQASGSTWMNWWSWVTSAKVSISAWMTSNQSPVPSDSPIAALNNAKAFSLFSDMGLLLGGRSQHLYTKASPALKGSSEVVGWDLVVVSLRLPELLAQAIHL